jgi:oligosaccharide repeat unit polymerase
MDLIIEREFYYEYLSSKFGYFEINSIAIFIIIAYFIVQYAFILTSKKVNKNSNLNYNFKLNHLVFINLIVLAIGSFLFYDFLYRISVFDIAQLQSEYRSGIHAGSGIHTYPFLIFLPILTLLLVARLDNNEKINIYTKLLLVVNLFIIIMIPLILGFRIYLVFSLLPIAIVYTVKNNIPLNKYLFYLLIFISFMSAYGYIRTNLITNYQDEVGSHSNILERVNGSNIFSMTLLNVDKHDYFKDIIYEPLIQIIPREFRLDHENVTVRYSRLIFIDFFNWRGDDFYGGISSTLFPFIYWQAGFLSLFISFFVVSFLGIYLSKKIIRSKTPFELAFYSIIGTGFVLLAESPQDSINATVTRIIVLLFYYFLYLFFTKCKIQ